MAAQIDGFAVPHGHFRVFHRGRGASDHLSLSGATPLTAVTRPCDLHLREFVQLEAQVKALEATTPRARGASGLVVKAQSAALAECLGFYGRLMTVESLTWPDFLTTVFTKLTEHFVTSDSEIVQLKILDVCRGARAHATRINDSSKILGHLHGFFAESPTGMQWQRGAALLETMPVVAKDDAILQSMLVEKLQSNDGGEQILAIAAIRALCPHSLALQSTVFKAAITSPSAQLTTLLPSAVMTAHDAQQAWNHSSRLYREQIADDEAVACLQSTFKLTEQFTSVLIRDQFALVEFVISHDPRGGVVAKTWSFVAPMAAVLATFGIADDCIRLIHKQLRSQPPPSTIAMALTALEQLLRHCNGNLSQVSTIGSLMVPVKCFGSAMVRIIANAAWREIHGHIESNSQSPIEDLPYFAKLTQQLHPAMFARNEQAWRTALNRVEWLVTQHPSVVGEAVGDYMFKLLVQCEQLDQQMVRLLWISLSRFSHFCQDTIRMRTADILESFQIEPVGDSKVCLSKFVCLLRAFPVIAMPENVVAALCDYACSSDPFQAYELAKLAMLHGQPKAASRIFQIDGLNLDHECFGGWVRALQVLGDAEASINASQLVTLTSRQKCLEARTLLAAAMTKEFKFEFQIVLLELRALWMDLVVQVQQRISEIKKTGHIVECREKNLRDGFRSIARRYYQLQMRMYGCHDTDIQCLDIQRQLCELIANALEVFLGLDHSAQDNLKWTSVPSSCSFISTVEIYIKRLGTDVDDKAKLLSQMHASRRALIGAQVLGQFLNAVCSIPHYFPRQFFRSKVLPKKTISASFQFLTHSELTSFTSKPRPRSQLGVAHGTDFTCSLVLAVRFSEASLAEDVAWLCVEVGVIGGDKVHESEAPNSSILRTRVKPTVLPAGTSDQFTANAVFLCADLPVVVSHQWLISRGTYSLWAKVSVVDTRENTWSLACTGMNRGIIVY